MTSAPKKRANTRADRAVIDDEKTRELVRVVIQEVQAHSGLTDLEIQAIRVMIRKQASRDALWEKLARKSVEEVASKGAVALFALIFFALVFGFASSWKYIVGGSP